MLRICFGFRYSYFEFPAHPRLIADVISERTISRLTATRRGALLPSTDTPIGEQPRRKNTPKGSTQQGPGSRRQERTLGHTAPTTRVTPKALHTPLTKRAATNLARKCRALGLFPDFTQTELAELLHTFRISCFEFVSDFEIRISDFQRTPAVLYDDFSGAMRSDTAVGSAHRQWLETESAVSKVPDDEQAVATLKTACLLGLAAAGARTRTPPNPFSSPYSLLPTPADRRVAAHHRGNPGIHSGKITGSLLTLHIIAYTIKCGGGKSEPGGCKR